jgi:DNA excision repair protein ERCC-3
VCELLENHSGESILIIGQDISQIEKLARELQLPIITGKTCHDEREKLYDEFRQGRIKILVVSKVANFAVDLPDASVMIQVSGTFGSRQEEAQRLGRILDPKREHLISTHWCRRGLLNRVLGLSGSCFWWSRGTGIR